MHPSRFDLVKAPVAGHPLPCGEGYDPPDWRNEVAAAGCSAGVLTRDFLYQNHRGWGHPQRI